MGNNSLGATIFQQTYFTEGLLRFRHIMSIDLHNIKAESRQLVLKTAHVHHCSHGIIVVDDDTEVVQLLGGGKDTGLPHGSLAELSVPAQNVDPGR